MTREEREQAAAEELCTQAGNLLSRIVCLGGAMVTDEDVKELGNAEKTLARIRRRISNKLAE